MRGVVRGHVETAVGVLRDRLAEPWTLAELIGSGGDIDASLRIYESRRWPRVETIRAAVRRRTVARDMEGPVTDDLLTRHPPVFSASLQVFDELIEDPFAGLSERASW